MKKIIFVILCIIICIFLFVSCKSSDAVENNSNNDRDIQIQENQSSNFDLDEQNTDTLTKQIKIGDKIVFDNIEICINDIEIEHKVVPDNTNGAYSYYKAGKGNVYSWCRYVKNNSKESLYCEDIGKVQAVYDDSYIFDSAFVVVEDDVNPFFYKSEIDMFETKCVKWLITCTEEIEKTDSELFVELFLNGKKFRINVRWFRINDLKLCCF